MLMRLGECSVGEVYSPPRVTARSSQFGVKPHFALDLTVDDDDGKPWDFSVPAKREKAKALVKLLKPYFLVGSPPCTAFSQLMNLNYANMSQQQISDMLTNAIAHVEFSCELYQIQIDEGRYFLHEAPDTATSWKLECVQKISMNEHVQRVTGDQCAHGMTREDWEGKGFVKKPTGWMTNSEEVAKVLAVRCTNRDGEDMVYERVHRGLKNFVTLKGKDGPDDLHWDLVRRRVTINNVNGEVVADERNVQNLQNSQLYRKLPAGVSDVTTRFYYKRGGKPWHRHIPLMNGRAKNAAIYPPKLVNNILKGIKRQFEKEGKLNSFEAGPVCQEHDLDPEWYESEFYDEISGKMLDPEMVKEARAKELEEIYKVRHTGKTLYHKVPIEECYEKTGKAPISVRWIDINKGDDEKPEYRSRLVAREIAREKRDDLFSSTPPLEALCYKLSRARTGRLERAKTGKVLKVQFLDISRAHFCCTCHRDVYVELCPEDAEEGMCAKLDMSLYGTRDAPQNWEDEYSNYMTGELGFVRGLSNGSLYYHPVRDIETSVHGDDFTSLGTEADLDWFETSLKKRYQVKRRALLGPDASDDKEIRILNRLVEWKEHETTYEADPRHAEIVIKSLGLESAKAVISPGTAELSRDDEKQLLDEKEAYLYRSCTMRASYLAADRPDLEFAVKECSREMKEPTVSSMLKLKRIARYLIGKPRLVWQYKDQPETTFLDMYVDTDDAGCKKTRKSTSSGKLMIGKHLIKTYSSTQADVGLSSGESEFYGIVKGGSASIGMKALIADYGKVINVRIHTDSSAAKAMVHKRGLGKAKHIDRAYLWIQKRVKDKEVACFKVPGSENIADVGTKHLPQKQVEYLLKKANLYWPSESSKIGLKS